MPIGRVTNVIMKTTMLIDVPDLDLANCKPEPVADVIARMRIQGIDRCPVVDASGRVVGFLSPSDISRADEEEFTLFGS